MFDLTQAAFKKTLNDFRKIVYATGVLTQSVYLVYLAYTLIMQKGNPIVNGILAGISLFYLIFHLLTTEFGKSPDGKKNLTKPVALAVKWSKKAIALYNIGVALYGLTLTAKAVTPFALILNALMLVGFLFGLIFDVIIHVVKKRAELFITGFNEDIKILKQPADKVGNFFKKLTGQEVETPPQKTAKEQKTLNLLQGIADRTKEERILSKQEKKAERKRKKQEAKASRKLKKLPTPGEEVAASESTEE